MEALHKIDVRTDAYEELLKLPPDEFDREFAKFIHKHAKQYVEDVMKMINDGC